MDQNGRNLPALRRRLNSPRESFVFRMQTRCVPTPPLLPAPASRQILAPPQECAHDSRSRYSSAGCARSDGHDVFHQCPRVPTRRGGGATGRVTRFAGARIFLILTGVFEGAGGVALVYARVAAGVLALFTVFVSLVFVRFWSFEGALEMRTILKQYFHRQRRDNRRTGLPRRTRSRRARAGGSLTPQAIHIAAWESYHHPLKRSKHGAKRRPRI